MQRGVQLLVVAALGLVSMTALAAKFFVDSEAPVPASAQSRGGAGSCVPTSTLSQSTSLTITSGNSVFCDSGTNHRNNSYFRSFSVSAYPAGFRVCSVQVGIEDANAGDPATAQPITVNLFANTGAPFPAGTRVAIGTATVQVTDQNRTVISVPVAGALSASAQLVAEVFTPSGVAAGHRFVIGSNASGQSAPTYIQAADCGIPTPVTAASLGFPDMHLVLQVAGSEQPLIFANGFEATGG